MDRSIINRFRIGYTELTLIISACVRTQYNFRFNAFILT
ncbi:hypothetical protein LMANV2_470017 [Leptospira interrogans serovar Manilae]|uniref:Uncharacterized protein n=1 Tax=Leptospira interrogans serovar Manilae TaxID=214675 RepID=A0AAQ1SPK7_LEPIR|nr:hypothetical protein LMANV2_470017 [Leptospira interrogans serovar Manilae]